MVVPRILLKALSLSLHAITLSFSGKNLFLC